MKLILGDCLKELKKLKADSVDSIVTDPPYGINFMSKKWDYDVPKVEMWQEAIRVLKPGGYALIACGTRTQHRMTVNIEDAGFEIRDIVAWIYGSGFPKSLNIGKAVDKLQGNEREVTGTDPNSAPDLRDVGRMSKEAIGIDKLSFGQVSNAKRKEIDITKGNSPYEGWGTALKPAMELWTLARKPLSEKTVAENVLKHGTGGINIDGGRVEMSKEDDKMLEAKSSKNPTSNYRESNTKKYGDYEKDIATPPHSQGRFPANVIHDGSDEVVDLFPDSKAGSFKGDGSKSGGIWSESTGQPAGMEYGDSGSAARFFYTAKAPKGERNKGLDGFEAVEIRGGSGRVEDGYDLTDEKQINLKEAARKYGAVKAKKQNIHPTVKPVSLMRYLCKLITPPKGIILDPFMGSGTTGMACKRDQFRFIGIELDKDYFKIAENRIKGEPESLF